MTMNSTWKHKDQQLAQIPIKIDNNSNNIQQQKKGKYLT